MSSLNSMISAIRDRREELQLSYRKLGKMAGISYSTVCRLENMSALTRMSYFFKVCRALGFKIIIYETGNSLGESSEGKEESLREIAYDVDDDTIVKTFKNRRIEFNMTYKEIQDISKVSWILVSEFEDGDRDIEANNLIKIYNALDMEIGLTL